LRLAQTPWAGTYTIKTTGNVQCDQSTCCCITGVFFVSQTNVTLHTDFTLAGQCSGETSYSLLVTLPSLNATNFSFDVYGKPFTAEYLDDDGGTINVINNNHMATCSHVAVRSEHTPTPWAGTYIVNTSASAQCNQSACCCLTETFVVTQNVKTLQVTFQVAGQCGSVAPVPVSVPLQSLYYPKAAFTFGGNGFSMEYNTVNGGTISVTEYDNPTCTSFAVKNDDSAATTIGQTAVLVASAAVVAVVALF